MTTSELIKRLQEVDPEGNTQVAAYVAESCSVGLNADLIHKGLFYADPSTVDPVYYYDDPDDEEDVPVTLVYIA